MKLCPYPFSRLQTSNFTDRFDNLFGTFLPCVPSWFKDEYFKLKKEDKLDDIWNGVAAQELRKRMYEGDFSFCDRKACQIPLFSIDELADPDIVFKETPIPPENIEAIKNKNPIMPSGPSSLYLTSDFTCNLNCPICRNKIITNEAKPTDSALEEFDYVFSVKDSLEVIKLANGGEVFYSKLQRKLLKSLNNDDFPKLRRVHIVSNGTMFNKKNYDLLHPGTKFIRDVNISLDAATKEIYEIVRGPNFDDVIKNVKWLGEMRKSNNIEFYSFHIIIVKDNFRDIPNIINLAKENNVDRVLLQPFLANPYGQYNTEEQSVHFTSHPDHKEFMDLLFKYKDEPILYSYFDIPEMNEKINKDVLISKAQKNYKIANKFFTNKQFKESINYYLDAINQCPEYYFYFELAESYREINDLENAIMNYKLAIKLKENYFDAFFGLSITFKLKGLPEEASIWAQKAISLEPNNQDLISFIQNIKH